MTYSTDKKNKGSGGKKDERGTGETEVSVKKGNDKVLECSGVKVVSRNGSYD